MDIDNSQIWTCVQLFALRRGEKEILRCIGKINFDYNIYLSILYNENTLDFISALSVRLYFFPLFLDTPTNPYAYERTLRHNSLSP